MDQPEHNRCDNCHTELAGEFCFACGQSARQYDVAITTFAKNLVSESLDLDSRLRATMRPLFFRPGLVPRDYVAGHRARFVPPFRLYLLASFAMFLLMSLGSGIKIGTSDGPQVEVDLRGGRVGPAVEGDAGSEDEGVPDGVGGADAPDTLPDPANPTAEGTTQRIEQLERSLETRLSEGLQRMGDDPAAFAEAFSSRMAQAMFLLLPVFAFLLKLLYPKRLFVHHLVFAIYFHAWFFLVVAVTMLPGAMGLPRVSDVMAILLLWSPVYLFLAMRRFYEQSRLLTFVMLFILSNVYLLLASLTMLAVVFLAIAGT